MPGTLWTDFSMETLDKKFYKIREVSEMVNIPESTLRFWETKFPILKPKRNAGNTRFYSPADIEKIRMIHYMLKDKGMKIDAVVEQLRIDPSGVSRRYEAINRLKAIRDKLNSLLFTLNKLK